MANEEHLARLRQGVEGWNQWRRAHPEILPDLAEVPLPQTVLRGADLCGANLFRAVLTDADLRGATLGGANLFQAHLAGADLCEADLRQAALFRADLTGAALFRADLAGARLTEVTLSWADLREATLAKADFTDATLIQADLAGADLMGALLLGTNFEKADLTGCFIYGISAWNVKLVGTTQLNLVITSAYEPRITVDNLEVAQFIYLLLHNEKIREVIDTIGKTGVLVLGRFAGERKAVLDALRTALRDRGFLPMVFDFEKPTQRDFTETIMTLAGLSLFVIADITNPRSTPLELQATVPDYMIPFVPIIAEGEEPFPMFRDLQIKHD